MLENGLGERVAVYCPTRDSVGELLPNAQSFVTDALTQLSALFGGATANVAEGAWINDDGTLIREQVTIVYAFASELSDNLINSVVALCEKIKAEGKQAAVSLEVNGKLFFV